MCNGVLFASEDKQVFLFTPDSSGKETGDTSESLDESKTFPDKSHLSSAKSSIIYLAWTT